MSTLFLYWALFLSVSSVSHLFALPAEESNSQTENKKQNKCGALSLCVFVCWAECEGMFQVLSQEELASKHSSAMWKCVFACCWCVSVCVRIVKQLKVQWQVERRKWPVVMATQQAHAMTWNHQGCVFQRVNDKPVKRPPLWFMLTLCNHHRGRRLVADNWKIHKSVFVCVCVFHLLYFLIWSNMPS